MTGFNHTPPHPSHRSHPLVDESAQLITRPLHISVVIQFTTKQQTTSQGPSMSRGPRCRTAEHGSFCAGSEAGVEGIVGGFGVAGASLFRWEVRLEIWDF